MDLSNCKKIYMIGIKGVGMTMLAQYLARQGIVVSGSDTGEKFMTDEVLKKEKIKVAENFAAGNIPADADLIVYSSAYTPKNNIELKTALENSRKIMAYAEALSVLFNQKYGIAVVGSHGKTTTTAWLGYVLDKAGKRPGVMAGARIPQFDGNTLSGASDYLVAELDEYQNKLKYFKPQAVVLTNIEYDHPDFFPALEDYQDVFIEFIKKIPKRGFLVANNDDPTARKIAPVNCRSRVISYAIEETADFTAYGIKTSQGKQYFKVKMSSEDEEECELKDVELGDFSIALAGRHNVSNALAVIAACVELDVELWKIRQYLGEFLGAERRMQILGHFRGAVVIDDYAHHPTEIKASLSAVKELYPKNKIITVFHPHTFTRTKALLDDFAGSFSGADEIIVLDIYGSAREEQGGVNSRDLVQKIKAKSNRQQAKILHIPNLKQCEEYLRANIARDDVVVLMGAGDVFRIGKNLVK